MAIGMNVVAVATAVAVAVLPVLSCKRRPADGRRVKDA